MLKGLAFVTLLLLLLLSSLHFASSGEQNDEYSEWKAQYGIKIKGSEDVYRKFIFMRNLQTINKHNEKVDETYTMGVNQFSHLSSEEFSSLYSSRSIKQFESTKTEKLKFEENNLEDIDWDVLGYVSKVKNQGNCDAGYAFSTASLYESSLLYKKQNITLAEQQFVDCGANYTMMGCSGGSRLGAINYTNDKGLDGDAKYPYQGKQGSCQTQSGQNKFSLKMLQADGCTDIRNLLNKTPQTIAVNTENWQHYRSGILSDCGNEVSHDIYLVGATLTYWRLKNSWGNRWGEYGYIRLKLGNTCGICTRPGFGLSL